MNHPVPQAGLKSQGLTTDVRPVSLPSGSAAVVRVRSPCVMVLNLRQFHPGDCDALVTIWQAIVTDPLQVPTAEDVRAMIRKQPQLSLAVLDEHALIGAALCQPQPPSAWQHLLILHPDRHHPDVMRQAMDKTAVKLRARGLNRCQIRCLGEKTIDEVWPVLRWNRRPQFQPNNMTDPGSLQNLHARCVRPTPDVASEPQSSQPAGVTGR